MKRKKNEISVAMSSGRMGRVLGKIPITSVFDEMNVTFQSALGFRVFFLICVVGSFHFQSSSTRARGAVNNWKKIRHPSARPFFFPRMRSFFAPSTPPPKIIFHHFDTWNVCKCWRIDREAQFIVGYIKNPEWREVFYFPQ